MLVDRLVHPSVYLLVKLSLGQIKSREVNSSHFGCDHGIDEEKTSFRSILWWILELCLFSMKSVFPILVIFWSFLDPHWGSRVPSFFSYGPKIIPVTADISAIFKILLQNYHFPINDYFFLILSCFFFNFWGTLEGPLRQWILSISDQISLFEEINKI